MFSDERDLELVAANDVADEHVVSPVVSAFGCAPRHRVCLLQDDFVSVEQPRNLDGYFFTSFRRSRNQRRLRDIMSHREAHAPEHLDSFGDFVDKLVLLVVVRIEKQMQLMERWPCDLPVMLFVQIAQL